MPNSNDLVNIFKKKLFEAVMAKRFSGTEKWENPWFCSLTPIYKLFWIYLNDRCNIAGIWEPNWPLVKFHLWEEKLDVIIFGERIKVLPSGKWYIVPHILFQQKINSLNDLNPKNKAHLGIIRILEKEGLQSPFKGASKGLHSPIGIGIGVFNAVSTPVSPPKILDEEKNGIVVSEDIGRISYNKLFEEIWAKYPNKDGKKAAERSFKASVKTKEDWVNIQTALNNYNSSERVSKGMIKNGSTWFHNWRDWVINPIGKTEVNKFKEIEDKLKPTPRRMID